MVQQKNVHPKIIDSSKPGNAIAVRGWRPTKAKLAVLDEWGGPASYILLPLYTAKLANRVSL